MINRELDIERLLEKIQILKEEVGLSHKKIRKDAKIKRARG